MQGSAQLLFQLSGEPKFFAGIDELDVLRRRSSFLTYGNLPFKLVKVEGRLAPASGKRNPFDATPAGTLAITWAGQASIWA